MRKITALALVLFTISVFCLMMSVVGSAASWCVNQTYRTVSTNITLNGEDYVFGPNTENCVYGCAGGQCVPSPGNDSPLAMAILFGVTAMALIYLGLNLKEDYAVMSWLFIPLAIVLLAGGVFYVSNMGVFQDNMMQSLAWIFYSLILIVVIIIFIFLLRTLTASFRGIFPYSKGYYDEPNKK